MLKRAMLAGLALTGHLFASGITCNFNGGATTSLCYGAGVSFSSNDSLNFLTAFGSAAPSSNNPYNEAANGGLIAATANGVGVTVSLGGGGVTMPGGLVVPGGDSTYIGRVDNTQDVWTDNAFAWDGPGDPNYNTPAFMHYAGQFAAPTAESSQTEAQGGWGAYLLGPASSNGTPGNSPLVFNFSHAVAGVGFNISTVSASTLDTNTNFLAEIDAYDGKTLLGSYFLTATGLGGYCPTVETFLNDPAACNDAPFIGFGSTINDITSVTVDAIDSSGNLGFYLANMVAKEDTSVGVQTPEPGARVLSTSGFLFLLGLWRRQRLANHRG